MNHSPFEAHGHRRGEQHPRYVVLIRGYGEKRLKTGWIALSKESGDGSVPNLVRTRRKCQENLSRGLR
jgi:hypothetical protein